MKSRFLLITLALLAFIALAPQQSQAQSFAYNFSGGFINTATLGGSIGHQQVAPFGQFTGSEAWAALGQSPFPSPITGDAPYGLRNQRNGTGTLFQIQRRSSGSSIFDSNIFFGDVVNSPAEQAPSRLDFRYFFQNQGTSPPVLTQTAPITMIGASTKPVSSTLSQLCFFPVGGNGLCFIRMGIERTNPSYSLDVNGIIRANNVTVSSDARFKKDINTIENGMGVIQNLRGTTYNFRSDEDFGEGEFDFGDSMESGFIAQEMEEILPHLVYTDDQGYKSVNYMGVIPYLVEATKEMDATSKQEIAQLKAENAEMRQELAEIKALLNDRNSDKGTAAGTFGAATLFQNTPNPFDQATEIRYALPEGSGPAQLLVFDMNGRQLRSYDLQAGEGTVTIDGSELDAGMYFYSLVTNGEEIATKRMILTK